MTERKPRKPRGRQLPIADEAQRLDPRAEALAHAAQIAQKRLSDGDR